MDFLALKNHLMYLSGRYDLAQGALGTADVIGTFINQACRALDRATSHQKSPAEYFTFIEADAFHASIQYCRAIKEVWLASTTARWQLEKMPLADLITEYYLSNDDVSSGTPLFYSPVITRRIPEGGDISSFSSYMTYLDSQTGIGQDYNAIVIAPPTDTKVMADIRGLFYTKTLSFDNDTNYWSVNHPLTLLKTALDQISTFTEGKFKDSIIEDIIGIDKDLIEEEIAETDQMEKTYDN